MFTLGVSFTNFGPYHLARLRALGRRLAETGGRLIAYETAGTERLYPWRVAKGDEPFTWTTLFAERALEDVSRVECAWAMRRALERDRPHAVAVAGYVRPEALAAATWARRAGAPAILMSETQKIDHPRVWWKETIKRRRVQRFSAALVGGPRHRSYLVDLGMAADRIALGYNAVDNDHYARVADTARRSLRGQAGLPSRPYFLAVSRFAPEKNLLRLIRAFAAYRAAAPQARAWDLVLCGSGPAEATINAEIEHLGLSHCVHRPGFVQADALPRWYAFASGFIHPSVMEPWGLVMNEAAACGLPLLVSDRAGAAETLVPDPPGTTGWQFDPFDEAEMCAAMARLAGLTDDERRAMGDRAAEVVSSWGPDRFAKGVFEALFLAAARRSSPSPSMSAVVPRSPRALGPLLNLDRQLPVGQSA